MSSPDLFCVSLKGNNDLGVYCRLTNSYGLVGVGADEIFDCLDDCCPNRFCLIVSTIGGSNIGAGVCHNDFIALYGLDTTTTELSAIKKFLQPDGINRFAVCTEIVKEALEKNTFKIIYNLENQLQHLQVQENYLKLEIGNLEKELLLAQVEVKRIQAVPLVIGQFLEAVDQDHAIVGSTTGSNYYVRVLSTLDRELLKTGCSVALHKYSYALVDVLPPEADSSIQMLRAEEKPDVSYGDIGGLDMQMQEIREAVELSLTQEELYQQIGIDPPRGVLMYGPSGCGKTARQSSCSQRFIFLDTSGWIRVCSKISRRSSGQGSRMVRDVFRLAKENAPSIIFIDEIDAIATKRFDAQTGVDREVQRILLELLNQMDGFDPSTNVKVIMATNRLDTLDPALLRPGRLDRKIEFPLKMNFSDDVEIEDYVARPDKICGADINAICQAGMHAVRENRYVVLTEDFEKASRKIKIISISTNKSDISVIFIRRE